MRRSGESTSTQTCCGMMIEKGWTLQKNTNSLRVGSAWYISVISLSDSGCIQSDVRSWESGPACLLGWLLPPAGLLCPRLFRGSRQIPMFQACVALFWQRFCEHTATPSITISVPSQIAVDCKSVHCGLSKALLL